MIQYNAIQYNAIQRGDAGHRGRVAVHAPSGAYEGPDAALAG